MTFKNNKAPLLCCFKLCASFQNHQCIQTGVTVRKHSIWVKNWWFFVLCDLEFRQMTLKNNRAPVLCYFRALCIISKPSVNSNWSYSLETFNSGQNWQFVSCVTLKFDGRFKKTIEHLFYATSSFIHHFVTISEFKHWIYSPEMPKLGRNLFWPPWPLTFCMDITFVNGNYPWKFHDDMIAGTLWKRCQTERRTDKQTKPFLELGSK